MYGQTYTTSEPTTQKKKIIIVSLIMGIIIIVLIGVLINAIMTKRKNALNEASQTSSEVVKATNLSGETVTDDSNTKTDSAESEHLEPVSGDSAVATVTPSSDVKSDLPATGPEGVLGFALLMGSASMLFLARNYKKSLLF